MSRHQHQKPTSTFASRTAFDALEVESGESEDESFEEIEGPQDVQDASNASIEAPQDPPKKSKSARKKAALLARQQARQEKKAKRTVSSASDEPSSTKNSQELASPKTEEEVLSPPAELILEAPEPSAGPQATTSPPNESISNAKPPINESVSAECEPDSELPDVSNTPNSSHKPVDFPSSTVDITIRQTSQSPAGNPPSKNTDKQDTSKSKRQQLPEGTSQEAAEKLKKRQSFFTRTLWTLIMIGGFLLCLAAGHAYMIMLVMVCQTLVYREVTALFAFGVPKSEDDGAKGKDPWSKTMNWYFFAVTNFFLYGESIIYYFKHVVFADWHFSLFAANHRFTSFTLYIIGFVGFVYSLQRQHLKSQFGLFCWVHMSLLVIVVSSHFIMNNILEGLIWFWVPASLVICNDIFAYIWGITMGRTPLFQLSPKKTVEGFVGAFFSTILFGQIWGTLFMRSNYMICPAHDLGMNAFSDITCAPNPVFVWRAWEIPSALQMLLAAVPLPGFSEVRQIPYAPYQFHLLVMSCFASLVAPFGGFFASGFKRAFNIKDFGHSIPGHGGMTDRMDCQFLMGVFTYVYYSSLVKEHHVTVGHVLQLIVSNLTLEEQIELMGDFKRYLEGRGVSL
ncbi:phosphatidate cytidylyltransferase [Pyrrhoderma noxium]|uniref:Phosphatidate cytidylyltransferase n=1 Tax=Pyrrhoderma noxium TaxID=2282107 RepID=A0A286UHA7_9AGAM|nr:phosphatidate cytidylyltransferase [Pyrrhoderma noxium]